MENAPHLEGNTSHGSQFDGQSELQTKSKKTRVTITVPALKKGQSQSFKLPNLRSKKLLIDRLIICSDCYNWDLRITSRGNVFLNCSTSLLSFYENNLALDRFGHVANHTDLLMQLKALSNTEECKVVVEYIASEGFPQFYSEFTMRTPADRDGLLEQIVREVKKIEVTEINFLTSDVNISKIVLVDPYQIGENERCHLVINRQENRSSSVFRLVADDQFDLETLSRMQIQCWDKADSESYPNQIGVVVFGFQN